MKGNIAWYVGHVFVLQPGAYQNKMLSRDGTAAQIISEMTLDRMDMLKKTYEILHVKAGQ